MELISLKNQLSEQWRKPKRERDYDLIRQLHQQIKEQKSLLIDGFKKRQKETRQSEVKNKSEFIKKRNAQYKKIKAHRIEEEKKNAPAPKKKK